MRLLGVLMIVVVTSLVIVACGGGEDDPTPETTEDGESTEATDAIDGRDEPSGVTLTDGALVAEVVTAELDQPTAVAFAQDDMLVTEKATGKVRIVRDGEIVGDAIDLAVNYFDERGLLGIAVHPDFPAEPFVYLHWTWTGEGEGDDQLLGADSDEATSVPALGNRIDRFRWEDDALTFDRSLVEFPSHTLDTDTSGNVRGNHDAGPLTFGPDGKLYTMMGDQNLRGQLQNITDGPQADDEHFAGVILRLNDDGTIPEDNPFFDAGAEVGGEVGENIQMIHTYGIRNSFGLAFEPGSGALWQTENGDDSWDEINVFDPGANSGWIQLMGPPERMADYRQMEMDTEDGLDNPEFPPSMLAEDAEGAQAAMFSLPGSVYAPPVLSYVYPPALTAIGFVGDDSLGEASERTAWVGTVLTDSLLRYPLAADGRSLELEGGLADGVDDNEAKGDLGESEEYVVGKGFGTITDIQHGPDGGLYVLSISEGSLYRISAA
ncbi:MAG: PQQ-dependent sugar dehydrogenase [Egibacteraceae bacterium]